MPLAPGTRLGPYEILGPLGAGGMGEVYKARDTRLERTVALKVIQSAIAVAPEMHERFQREARAISALDHPHICMLYDVCDETPSGASDAVSFLVMQYLEGETLADRLARAAGPASDPSRPASGGEATRSTGSRGPIPFDTALKYAVEIAQALDAAHRRGIVHRDLKPGNVMVTKTGTKLLDFGLAKLATESVAGVGIVGDAETRLSPLTGQGAILGTLYYMSPEQLEGRDVDTRSDIHAFGALLYEMLSGRRAFDAESQAGVIAAIVSGDAPSLTSLADTRTSLPIVARRALDRLLAKCLAKDPDHRWQSAADLAAELEWIAEERTRPAVEPSPVAPAHQRSPVRERIWMGVAAAAVLALGVVGYRWYPRPAPPPMPITFAIDAPEGETLSIGQGLLAVSPDGSRVAFTTGQTGGTRLWVRTMGALAAERVEHADGAFQPAWSPNGRSIAFTASGGPGPLRTIDLAGGPPRTLAPSASGRPAWGRGGVILFKGPGEKIYGVPEGGGEARAVMELDPSRTEAFIDWPVFLPDGRRYLFVTRGRDALKTGLFLASLGSPGRTLLVNVTSSVDYAAGYLFYQRDGAVMAHPFDAGAGRLSGDAFPVGEDVASNPINGRGAFSVSDTGAFSFVPRSGSFGGDRRRILLVDRSGKNVRQIGKDGRYLSAALSPDGRQAVVTEENTSTGVRRLSLLELERGISTPFTLADVDERYPLWSPDGTSIVFESFRDKGPGLYRRRAGGGATSDEELFHGEQGESAVPWGFSSDGERLLITRGSIRDSRIWMLPLAGDRKPVEVFPGSKRAQAQPVFSPDNKWIAYAEGETMLRTDVFVQPYPADGRRFPISTAGGANPQWTADGRRIIYRDPQGAVMSVDCTFTNGNLPPNPVELFRMARLGGPAAVMFSMDRNAERFLFTQPPERAEEAGPKSITVVLNFVQSLKKTGLLPAQ